jgi:double-stranded uracil-DNA glycosylase
MGAARPVLPDLLGPGLTTLFCGSAASPRSAALAAYYAGPGNRFWPTLHEIGLTDHVYRPAEYPALAGLGIGLTDLAKAVHGRDHALVAGDDDPAALAAKIARHRPRILAFTSKRPARVFLKACPGRIEAPYGRLPETVCGGVAVFVLPSPSGAARRWWDIAPWRALAAAHWDVRTTNVL